MSTLRPLKEQVVVITGGSSGIGRETARHGSDIRVATCRERKGISQAKYDGLEVSDGKMYTLTR